MPIFAIRRGVEQREMIAAIKAARGLYGMSLAEAKAFVLSGVAARTDGVQSRHEPGES